VYLHQENWKIAFSAFSSRKSGAKRRLALQAHDRKAGPFPKSTVTQILREMLSLLGQAD